MTETVVVNDTNTIVVDGKVTQTIVTGIMGPAGAATFAQMRDVDLTQLAAGSILIYNSGTSKWHATNLLDQQIVESGQF